MTVGWIRIPNADVNLRKSLVFRLALAIFLLLVAYAVVQQIITESALQAAILEDRSREGHHKLINFSNELKEHITPEFKESSSLALLLNFGRTNIGSYIFLTDAKGKILLSSLQGIEAGLFSEDVLKIFESSNPDFPQFISDPRNLLNKLPFVATPLKIREAKGYLVLLFNSDEPRVRDSTVENRAKTTAKSVLVNFVLISVATILIALVILRLFTQRLAALTKKISTFKPGEQIVFEGGSDEISILANAFSKMSDTISQQIELLENRDIVRRELIAGISHDLRTPIASLKGYLQKLAEQLQSGKFSEDRTITFLDVLQRNTKRLDDLVNSLFELSKLDAMQENLKYTVFPLSILIQKLVEFFDPVAKEAGVSLQEIESPSIVNIKADESLVERAISNIVDNAIRYTQKGGKVTVSVTSKSDEVIVEIRDTGEGIPKEKLPRIFDKFYRGDSARTDRGAGLGLAISQRIINAHKGRIEVESEVNKGTIFRIILPSGLH